MKNCSNCKKKLSLDSFSPSKYHKCGFMSHCKKCRAEAEHKRRQNKEYRKKVKAYKSDPKNKRQTKNMALQRLFGISIEKFDKMLKEQNYVCAICFQKETNLKRENLSVDHCHKTGKVRGLLCSNCNHGIGMLKDNIGILENAIKYLKETK